MIHIFLLSEPIKGNFSIGNILNILKTCGSNVQKNQIDQTKLKDIQKDYKSQPADDMKKIKDQNCNQKDYNKHQHVYSPEPTGLNQIKEQNIINNRRQHDDIDNVTEPYSDLPEDYQSKNENLQNDYNPQPTKTQTFKNLPKNHFDQQNIRATYKPQPTDQKNNGHNSNSTRKENQSKKQNIQNDYIPSPTKIQTFQNLCNEHLGHVRQNVQETYKPQHTDQKNNGPNSNNTRKEKQSKQQNIQNESSYPFFLLNRPPILLSNPLNNAGLNERDSDSFRPDFTDEVYRNIERDRIERERQEEDDAEIPLKKASAVSPSYQIKFTHFLSPNTCF